MRARSSAGACWHDAPRKCVPWAAADASAHAQAAGSRAAAARAAEAAASAAAAAAAPRGRIDFRFSRLHELGDPARARAAAAEAQARCAPCSPH